MLGQPCNKYNIAVKLLQVVLNLLTTCDKQCELRATSCEIFACLDGSGGGEANGEDEGEDDEDEEDIIKKAQSQLEEEKKALLENHSLIGEVWLVHT